MDDLIGLGVTILIALSITLPLYLVVTFIQWVV